MTFRKKMILSHIFKNKNASFIIFFSKRRIKLCVRIELDCRLLERPSLSLKTVAKLLTLHFIYPFQNLCVNYAQMCVMEPLEAYIVMKLFS